MFLVDTDVLSELPRARADARVVAWFELLPEFAVSPISIDELSYGIAKVRGKSGTRLREWFEALLSIPPTVIPLDQRIARAAGELRATRERKGRRVAQADMLIAATALVGGLTLATRNIDDFEGCGIPIIDPFTR
jgi:predicted nucleic acid-binding protein